MTAKTWVATAQSPQGGWVEGTRSSVASSRVPPPRPSPSGGGRKSGAISLLPRPSGERVGERGTRVATVVPRDAPTPAIPKRGREEFGACLLAPSPLWGEGWGEGHAGGNCGASRRPHHDPPPKGEGGIRGQGFNAVASVIKEKPHPATRPASIVMQRWHLAASCGSCVTKTSVVPSSWLSAIMSCITVSPVAKSRLPVGSSASSTAG